MSDVHGGESEADSATSERDVAVVVLPTSNGNTPIPKAAVDIGVAKRRQTDPS